METNPSRIPGAGPPKKGFWGAIASLFPRRPAPLDPPTPTAEVSPRSNTKKYNPSSTEPGGLQDKTQNKDHQG